MTSVGTVSVAFDGDTRGLEASGPRATKVLGTVSSAAASAQAKLAAPMSTSGLDGVKRAADGAAASLGRVAPAAATAQSRLEQLRGTAGRVDSAAGKLQVSMGGLSQAFGVNAGAAGNVVGGVADLAMSFAGGGPLAVAATVAGAGIAVLSSHFADLRKSADEARASAVASVKAIADSVAKRQQAADVRFTKALTGISDEDEVALAAARSEASGLRMELAAIGALAKPGVLGAFFEDQKITDARTRLTALDGEIGKIQASLDRAQSKEGWTVPGEAPEKAKKVAEASERHANAVERAAKAMQGATWNPADASATEAAMREGHQGPRNESEAFRNEENLAALASSFDGLDTSITDVTEENKRSRDVIRRAIEDEAAAVTLRQRAFDESGEAMAMETRQRIEAAQALQASQVGNVAGAVVAGAGFATLGGMAGSAVGALAAPLVGVDPLSGGAIGNVLGGLLGGLVDKLGPVEGLISTMMGGLGDLVGGLAPYFESLSPQVKILAGLLSALAPAMTELLEPVVAYQGVLLELLEVAIPLVAGILGISLAILRFTGIVKALGAFFDNISKGLDSMFQGIQRFTDKLDWLVGGQTPSGGGRSDGHVGGTYLGGSEEAQRINDENARADAENASALDDFLNGIKDNTEALQQFNQTLTNIPTGYRVPFYDAEVADGRGNAGVPTEELGASGQGVQYVNCTFNVTATSPNINEEIRKGLVASRGKAAHWPRGGNPGKSN